MIFLIITSSIKILTTRFQFDTHTCLGGGVFHIIELGLKQRIFRKGIFDQQK